MRIIHTFLFVLFFTTISVSQSFTLTELIKMSKMDVDNFDSYVTKKGFNFVGNINKDRAIGVTYALNLNPVDKKAEKFIKLYSKYFKSRFTINYQATDRNEYLKIKSQIKLLGFKFVKSEIFIDDFGDENNYFEYRKGKEIISIFASNKDYEVTYQSEY